MQFDCDNTNIEISPSVALKVEETGIHQKNHRAAVRKLPEIYLGMILQDLYLPKYKFEHTINNNERQSANPLSHHTSIN